MTPPEELRAAHKRLSELRDASSQGPWWITAGHDGRVEVGADQAGWDVIADRDVKCNQLPVLREDADLIVTLHRTIDAQLAVLAAGIHSIIWGADLTSEDPVVFLARTINGEAL